MLKYTVAGVVAIALVCLISSSVWALDVGQAAPGFKLADQFGKVWDVSALKGSVVVVIAADKHSGRGMDPWVKGLKEKYGSKIVLLGLLDLRDVPGIGRGIARYRIRRETSDPLMLDFKGNVADDYLVNSRNPIVVVIGKNLAVKAVAKSGYSESGYASIASAIDAAL